MWLLDLRPARHRVAGCPSIEAIANRPRLSHRIGVMTAIQRQGGEGRAGLFRACFKRAIHEGLLRAIFVPALV